MHWSNAYIGIQHREDEPPSHEAVNCWTLVCLIYAEILGIDLPTYNGAFASLSEVREIEALFAKEQSKDCWALKTYEAPLDVAVFRSGLHQRHVGVVVERGMMIHAAEGHPSRIERYNTGYWKPRLLCFYRHVEAASKLPSARPETVEAAP